MSIAGMSMSPEQTSRHGLHGCVFHTSAAEMWWRWFSPAAVHVFETFPWDWVQRRPGCCGNRGRAGETLFSYLPAPAFMSAGEQLFDDILRDNEITGAAASRLKGKSTDSCGGLVEESAHRRTGEFIQILQLGEMEHRADTCFISTSPVPSGEKKVGGFHRPIMPEGLRELALRLEAFWPTVCFWPQMLTASVFLP